MYVVLIALLAFASFYATCFFIGFVLALFVARRELREHQERWRFG